MTITCKKCGRKKHPAMFRDCDVKKRMCRECQRAMITSQPWYRRKSGVGSSAWRSTNANLFWWPNAWERGEREK